MAHQQSRFAIYPCSWHLRCIASDTTSTFSLQLPLADVAVMAKSHQGLSGAATSIGEQPYKVHLRHQVSGTAQMSDACRNCPS
jgi:phosphoribosylformylglycinamidine (FGAM) synthase-like enzyme